MATRYGGGTPPHRMSSRLVPQDFGPRWVWVLASATRMPKPELMTFASPTPRSSSADSAVARAGWRPLARHYVEMVLAMTAGMLVLGMARDLVGLAVPMAEHPGASYLLMATDMSIGMAAWMRFRGHGWAGTLEMCAAMYVPAVLV